ncbi:hypothetical protein AAFC00_003367 [Neodothiora populina]
MLFERSLSDAAFSSLVTYAVLFLVAVFSLHAVSLRDPTSLFFNPDRAYEPSYSAVRQEEAEAFVFAAQNASLAKVDNGHGLQQKKLCAGIPSVARDGASYLRTAVESLIDGLTAEERDSIYFIVFIPHTDATMHPAYQEDWLSSLLDRILLYDPPEDKMQHIISLERDAGLFREKGLLDHTYLLKACYAKETPYVAMFEDDILAMDGWYHRTLAGLEEAESRSARSRTSRDFLYLRLFYTEEFLGWNSEHWRIYLSWSLLTMTVLVTSLSLVRCIFPAGRKVLSQQVPYIICGVCLPLSILLFFAAGKVTVLPLPIGINEMNNYGCCSQGLVFSRSKAEELSAWFETKKIGFVDMLTEEYADQYDELRWALTPSVVQHIGRKSSKGDDFGSAAKHHRSVAEKLWNFAFENNNAAVLKQEHLHAVEQSPLAYITEHTSLS